MSNARNIASGAKFVDTAGDTMSGDLSVTGADVTITGSTNTDATLNVLSPNWVTGAYADINIAYQPTSRKIRGHYDNGIEIFTNNANAALKVDPNGRVTMPYQPAWSLQPNHSTQQYTSGVDTVLPHANTSTHGTFLNGGVTVNSSGRVTVPVAGKYFFYASFRQEGISAGYQVSVRLNNSAIVRGGVWYNSQPYENVAVSRIITLAANDYLEVYLYTDTTFNVSGSNDHLTFFEGFLIG